MPLAASEAVLTSDPAFIPPFCPNPACRHHLDPEGWRWVRDGTHARLRPPLRVRRFRCLLCRRCFSTQTFDTTYWLKRPDIQPLVLHRLVEGSGLRQIGRGLGVAGSTVQRHAERLGRHCLLFQRLHAPSQLPDEPLLLDGLQTFELSQFWPCDFNLLLGARTRFLHGFTDAELRRSGRMTRRQRRRRRVLEDLHGRPQPRATERAVELLLRCVVPSSTSVVLITDEHHAYVQALRNLPALRIHHLRVSSRLPRTPGNPLQPINALDLMVRHSSANHARETIAFSKRRQAAAERLAVFQVWHNFVKPRCIKGPRGSPTAAMTLGLASEPLSPATILHRRLFVTRQSLPEPLQGYYWRRVLTRQLPRCRPHALRFAA